jgi:hypothetical protein
MTRATRGCSSPRGGNGDDPKTDGCRGPPVVDMRYGEVGRGPEEGLTTRGDSGPLTTAEAE